MARPKKPTKLKVVQGTNRPHRNNNEPQVAIEIPPCPDYLGKEAKKYWDEIAEQLANVGLIGIVDGALFGLHCDSYGRFVEISKKIDTLDRMVSHSPNGMEIQSTWWQIRNKLYDQIIKTGTEFGLSPTARSKINLPTKSEKKDDGWAGL